MGVEGKDGVEGPNATQQGRKPIADIDSRQIDSRQPIAQHQAVRCKLPTHTQREDDIPSRRGLDPARRRW